MTIAMCFLLALVLDARGVVHSGAGMPDGPSRTVTLAVGDTALALAELAHLTWPWDRVESALGHKTQPAVPPLLAAGSGDTPGPPRKAAGVHAANQPRPGLTPTSSPVRQGTVRQSRRQPRHKQPPAALPVRRLMPRNPLRLLVTGDSLTEFFGPVLVNQASSSGPVRGSVDVHYGTGLARPDFVDWSVVARQQAATYHPEAVVVLMGGNDFQNMTLPNGQFFQAPTPAWTREYQRRAAICMRVWTRGGARRVYWLSIPPARVPAWAYADSQINLALKRAAAQVPGTEYLDIQGPITNHGRYADFVADGHGQSVLVRTTDGVHITTAGATIIAREVMVVLRREWHLR